MSAHKKALIFVVIVAGVILVSLLKLNLNKESINKSPVAYIKGSKLTLEIVDTPSSRERGLSGRQSLGKDKGMLFVYDKPEILCFWMKDMNFDIDILWFDSNKKLVYQKQQATPGSYPKESFCPPIPAQYILEVAAGTSENLKLGMGDMLVYPVNVKQ